MRVFAHLVKIIWEESSKLARLGYLGGIIIPNILASPIGRTIEKSLGMEEMLVIPFSTSIKIALGCVGFWTVYSLAKRTLRQEERLIPKFDLVFEPEEGPFTQLENTGGWVEKLYRVQVVNKSNADIESVEVKLNWLEPASLPGGPRHLNITHDNPQCDHSGVPISPYEYRKTFNLRGKGKQLIDVISIPEGTASVRGFRVREIVGHCRLRVPRKDYELGIVVIGKDVTRIEIAYEIVMDENEQFVFREKPSGDE